MDQIAFRRVARAAAVAACLIVAPLAHSEDVHFANPQDDARDAIALIGERLTLMPAVAAWYFSRHVLVSDFLREQQRLERSVLLA